MHSCRVRRRRTESNWTAHGSPRAWPRDGTTRGARALSAGQNIEDVRETKRADGHICRSDGCPTQHLPKDQPVAR